MSLNAQGLTFAYLNGPKLIDGLDLQVQAGESVVIMAPSGTGKTTLLSLLGGLRKPLSGSVKIEVAPAGENRPELSWVFQSMHLLPKRSVLDNVSIALLTQGHRREAAEKAAMEQLQVFKVAHLFDRAQKDISGGESQRVALARAAAVNPAVILADEPTANLDTANVNMVVEALFSSFSQSALIVTTHDQRVAQKADKLFVLEDGKLAPR